jgi:protein-S-isoprenylcysteine O-methyltransferase Ste14
VPRPAAPHLFLRALLAFLALPGVVAFLVPLALVLRGGTSGGIHPAALPLFAAGGALLSWCVVVFYREGRGTLAPWDPPRHLVATGPYRWSRNPMYVGVTAILVGWAAAFPSTTMALYAFGVVVAFYLRVVMFEEPWLARTHGPSWERYKRGVRRWI